MMAAVILGMKGGVILNAGYPAWSTTYLMSAWTLPSHDYVMVLTFDPDSCYAASSSHTIKKRPAPAIAIQPIHVAESICRDLHRQTRWKATFMWGPWTKIYLSFPEAWITLKFWVRPIISWVRVSVRIKMTYDVFKSFNWSPFTTDSSLPSSSKSSIPALS